MDYDCLPPEPIIPKPWWEEHALLGLLVLVIMLIIFYFLIKTGTKNGIIDALNDPAVSPIDTCCTGPCAGSGLLT